MQRDWDKLTTVCSVWSGKPISGNRFQVLSYTVNVEQRSTLDIYGYLLFLRPHHLLISWQRRLRRRKTNQTSTSNHETSNFGSTWQAWQDPRGCTLTAPFDNPVSLSSNQASKEQKETMGLGNINGYQGILRQPSAKELCIVAFEISFLHTYCSAYCQDNLT